MWWGRVLGLLGLCGLGALALKQIDNGLAPPEVVVQPIDAVFEPKCTVTGKKLDLIFIFDTSGSLTNKFPEILGVIERVLGIVAVGLDATRVALINFSGVAKVEFSFTKFTKKRLVIEAVKEIRGLKGITKLGAAMELASQELADRDSGARGAEVPKIVLLMTDGRAGDWQLADAMPDILRGMYPRGVLDIIAYGTGDYPAMSDLRRYVDDPAKLVTARNVDRLDLLFQDFKGVEVCEEKPICIPGSDKPMDLIFILDSSSSLGPSFALQVDFLQRLLTNMNIHPEAIRLALITFSTNQQLLFDWSRYRDADKVSQYLERLQPRRGTTNTRLALQQALKMFKKPWLFGGREGVPQMIIILTDGHSRTAPRSVVSELVNVYGVTIYALSVNSEERIDYRELVQLTGNIRDRVYTNDNLMYFEQNFIPQHIGFGCPGFETADPANFIQAIRGSVQATCESNWAQITIRTKLPFAGWLYVKDRFDNTDCVSRGSDSTEVKLTVIHGDCGVNAVPMRTADGRTGYAWNTTVMLQFHPEVITNVDQAIDVTCFHEQWVKDDTINSVPLDIRGRGKGANEATCQYHLEKYARDCVALDARVGEILRHDWECNFDGAILVHDCFVESDEKTLEIIDHDGCGVDPFILETPKYYTRQGEENKMKFYKAKQSSYVWKFPTAGSLRFHCKISFCDADDKTKANQCRHLINPTCPDQFEDSSMFKPKRRPSTGSRWDNPKKGFLRTIDVETRRLNVLESELLKPEDDVKYCSTSF